MTINGTMNVLATNCILRINFDESHMFVIWIEVDVDVVNGIEV